MGTSASKAVSFLIFKTGLAYCQRSGCRGSCVDVLVVEVLVFEVFAIRVLIFQDIAVEVLVVEVLVVKDLVVKVRDAWAL